MKKLLLTVFGAIMLSTALAEEKIPFNGMVTDLTGKPLKGVRIYVKSENEYAKSDKKGRFGLTDVRPTDTLKMVYNHTLYIIPVEGKKSLRVKLADQLSYEAKEDQELIDWGYGYVKQRENTAPRAGISGEELRKSGYSNVLEALMGRVPGLNIVPSYLPGEEASVNMRGINSINAPQTPLYLVDGVVVETLMNISVYMVDYVEILKDASIYGVRGANGAILVHTIKGNKK